MGVDQQLVTEIKNQLEDDILYFAWLAQIARLQIPTRTESECLSAVVESVANLHNDGTIVVGNARDAKGMVLIEAWPESNQDLRDRMESAITESDDGDRDFCFWIQLMEHYTR